jgi:D-serine deaminase-like pyridoxal phosphate-dependent protein
MSDIPFHQTRMGHAFLEGTMPCLVRELARLNANLERLLAVAEGQGGTVAPAAPPDPEDDR